MYHFVYLSIIETIKTGRVLYYVGKHSTYNLDDGYLGSGRVISKLLKSENKNPGKYKFTQIRSKFFESSGEAYAFEILTISEARDRFGDKLINISEGGIAPILRGQNHPMYGRKHTQDARDKISNIQRGRPLTDAQWKAREGRKLSDEHKQNLSKRFKGRKITDEQKKKLSDTLTGRKRTEYEIECVKKGQRAKKPHWKFYDELYDLWLAEERPGICRFAKIAISNGYPTVSYNGMVLNFVKDFEGAQ
ncbi:NUMOD3 domain-containing DNA-binding protein [Kluyvera intermedia]|uniref:NUMOD3 domain-containing DNA-binding protein n=1 Tax=Kluyvera intermedia TaxID=61648 RepID=UPI0034A512DC